MLDQLVRLLGIGQELNNKFKIVIVSISSFICGVIATILFNHSRISNLTLTPRQKELQAIAIEAEKRPFFPLAAPVGKADFQEQ